MCECVCVCVFESASIGFGRTYDEFLTFEYYGQFFTIDWCKWTVYTLSVCVCVAISMMKPYQTVNHRSAGAHTKALFEIFQ